MNNQQTKKRRHDDDADDDYGRGIATIMTTNDGPKKAKLDDIVYGFGGKEAICAYLVQILHFMYYVPTKNCVIYVINVVTSLNMTRYLIATKMI